MFEVALVAFTTLFATIGPLDVAVTYAGLTATHTPSQRRMMAIKGVAIASGILLLFAIFGNSILVLFGISLPALRIAGGILLLIIAMELVFAKQSAPASATPEDAADAATKNDFSVFPLATPLIAGPGAIGATILLVTDAEGDPMQTTAMFAGPFRCYAFDFGDSFVGITDSAHSWPNRYQRCLAGCWCSCDRISG